MKNLFILASLVFLVSCAPKETTTAPEERAIGFNTFIPEKKWHLGTEGPIQLVIDLDKLWSKSDYEAMKPFFSDTVKCYFPDGKVANSPQEFVDILKAQEENAEFSWTFDYAFSVDLDPSMGGEHVQAGFSGTTTKDGVVTKDRVHESYYIIDGKIVMWNQFKQEIKE